MTLIIFGNGRHPCPSVLGDVFFVPVILSLVSLSRILLEWGCYPAPGIRRCWCDTLGALPVETGLRSLWASPFREEGYKREVTVTVYDYKIRQNGMVCLGTL